MTKGNERALQNKNLPKLAGLRPLRVHGPTSRRPHHHPPLGREGRLQAPLEAVEALLSELLSLVGCCVVT